MPLTDLLNRPCTIVRRADSGAVNDYGDAILDETTVATVCELQQRQRTEDTEFGSVATSAWLLVLPASVDIRLGDSVTVGDATFEVDGEPWYARLPTTGQISHVEVTLKRSAGIGEAAS